MRSSLRRLIAPLGLAVVLVTASVLSGCSDAHNKAAAPSESASITASQTEASTEAFTMPPINELYPHPKPEMPALAKEHSKEGAMAFAEYFWESYAYSLATLDKSFFQEKCAPTAVFCQENMKIIDKMVDTSSYYEGFYLQDPVVMGALPGGNTDRVEWGVQVVGSWPAYTVWLQGKTSSKKSDGYKFVGATEVFWDEGWKVEDAEGHRYEEVYGE